jgi:flagellar hook-basal body complex protein FliE
MSDMSIQQVLAQMRALKSAGGMEPAAQPGATNQVNFAELMNRSLEKVNENQQVAAEMSAAFERGDPDADLTDVMIAMQKARISFEAMSEVRNKLVDAYKEIQNMPI